MNTRPILSVGAAFLLTVVAALFAPRILPLVALPLATAVAVTRLRNRQVTALAVGCLAAVLCCGVFWFGGGAAVEVQSVEPVLRSSLAAAALELNPAPATGITLAVVLGDRSAVPSAVRDALQRSGMSHLMSVSGLHISIAAAGAGAIARRLRFGKLPQFCLMTATVVVFWLASGMSVSATRAVIMVLLGLGAQLLGRRADGLTSLSLAAMLLVGLEPPTITSLSFQLSFLAVLGILLLSPPLTRQMEAAWQVAFGGKRAVPHGLVAAVAVSLSAQLAVTTIIGWSFGAVPLLGVVTNLVAIPLVYPIMLLGLLGCAAMAMGLGSVAAVLLAVANIFSQLLAWLAQLTAALPFCSFNTLFPSDFAAMGLIITALLLAICLPTGVRCRRQLAAGVAVVGGIMAVVSVTASLSTVSVVASSYTGSLMIASPNGTVVLDNANDNYWRQRDRDLLACLGHGDTPDALLATYPYTDSNRLQGSTLFYGVDKQGTLTTASLDGYRQLADEPVELVAGITARAVAPYCTEIVIGTTKLMKYDAEYDTIVKNYCTGLCATVTPAGCSSMRNCTQTQGVCDTIAKNHGIVPADGAVLADMWGNLLDTTGTITVLRRPDGTSCLRIPI